VVVGTQFNTSAATTGGLGTPWVYRWFGPLNHTGQVGLILLLWFNLLTYLYLVQLRFWYQLYLQNIFWLDCINCMIAPLSINTFSCVITQRCLSNSVGLNHSHLSSSSDLITIIIILWLFYIQYIHSPGEAESDKKRYYHHRVPIIWIRPLFLNVIYIINYYVIIIVSSSVAV
jgi:hypothetical protein